MNNPPRIVILSDTHLGKTHGGARSATMLRPLLEAGDQLIINGDVAEGVYPHLREQASRQVEALGALCHELRVSLTLLAGNHDPLISPLRSLDLAGGQVHVTHGDRIHPAISPWAGRRRHRRELDWRRVREQAESEGLWPESLARDGHMALHTRFDEHVRPPVRPRGPRRAWDIAHQAMWASFYWRIMPRLADKHAAQVAPDARFFIFGHIHRSGIWNNANRTLINTGSFGIPGRPRGVVIQNDRLTVRKIHHRSGAWRWAGPGLADFALKPTALQTPTDETDEAGQTGEADDARPRLVA